MNIDPTSHVPIYLQIANAIREAVAAGIYLPGEAIPSLKAMSLEAQVNPNTVQKAYDELAREGLIYSQRGKGLFVAAQGKTSAKVSAQESIERAFHEGVRAAWAAGMSATEIRTVFNAILKERMRSQVDVEERDRPDKTASATEATAGAERGLSSKRNQAPQEFRTPQREE